jgi:hypothetical protein
MTTTPVSSPTCTTATSWRPDCGWLDGSTRSISPTLGIYLTDPRRVEPAKLRTILRQPVEESPAVTPT